MARRLGQAWLHSKVCRGHTKSAHDNYLLTTAQNKNCKVSSGKDKAETANGSTGPVGATGPRSAKLSEAECSEEGVANRAKGGNAAIHVPPVLPFTTSAGPIPASGAGPVPPSWAGPIPPSWAGPIPPSWAGLPIPRWTVVRTCTPSAQCLSHRPGTPTSSNGSRCFQGTVRCLPTVP